MRAVRAAKKAGTAGVEAVDMLELCVKCPASMLRTLLDCMTTGIQSSSLAELAELLAEALDPAGAGERGVLLVYNDLMESPGSSFVFAFLRLSVCPASVDSRRRLLVLR